MRRVATAALALLLAACSGSEPALTPAQSAALVPADARLAQLYEGACKGCHTVADAQAPLTGNRAQWGPRWAKGEAALLASALQGKGGMPAGGQCFACTPDDLAALIRFMAGRSR